MFSAIPLCAIGQGGGLSGLAKLLRKKGKEAPLVVDEREFFDEGERDVGLSEEAKEKDSLEEHRVERVGIDTSDLDDPQGNWLLKRIWDEQAQERYEQVRSITEHVLEYSSKFAARITDFSRLNFDELYAKIGIAREDIMRSIDDLAERAQKKETKESSAQLRSSLEKLAQNEQDFHEGLAKIHEASDRVRQHEKNAWNYFKEISHLLSDERAREYYFKIDEAFRNITAINRYIKEQLALFFERAMGQVRTEITNIEMLVANLRREGLSMRVIRSQPTKSEEENGAAEEDEDQGDEDEEERVSSGGIMDYVLAPFRFIMSGFSYLYDVIVRIIRMPYDLIFGSTRG